MELCSVTDHLSDTQPISPFRDDIPLTTTIDPEADGKRGGCGMRVLIGGVLLLLSVAIVALAGLAGWTNGQREANRILAATHSAAVDEQISSIPGDVESGNLVLLNARILWLMTQTPGVSNLSDIMATGTALYINHLPTPTFTPSPTFEPTTTPDTQQVVIPTPENGSYDLAALLSEAQADVSTQQWQDAIDLLDVILGVDPTFQTAQVRQLMSEALNSYARYLYNANQPAAANLIVGRATEFGPLAEGLSFERDAAELFLTAKAGVSTGSQTAINALNQLLGYGPGGRYYQQAVQMLADAYIRRGDAYVAQGNPCAAVGEYQQAANTDTSGLAYGKFSSAQAACAAAQQPTADPNWMLTPGAVAPVGVVSPPGQ